MGFTMTGMVDITRIFRERTAVTAALACAAEAARWDAIRHGEPLAVWRNGRVAWVLPDVVTATSLDTDSQPARGGDT